jgi:hypothetical protein
MPARRRVPRETRDATGDVTRDVTGDGIGGVMSLRDTFGEPHEPVAARPFGLGRVTRPAFGGVP